MYLYLSYLSRDVQNVYKTIQTQSYMSSQDASAEFIHTFQRAKAD